MKSSVMSILMMPVSHEIPFLVELFSRYPFYIIALIIFFIKVISRRQKVEGLFQAY